MIQLSPQEKTLLPARYFTNSPLAPPAPVEAQVIEEARVTALRRGRPRARRRRRRRRPSSFAHARRERRRRGRSRRRCKERDGKAGSLFGDARRRNAETEEELKKLAEKTTTKRFPKITSSRSETS